MLKPPYLSEKESIDDAVKSAIDAAPHVDKISINPVNVQKNTVVEKLWFRNEWVAPWLWSVVDVLKSVKIYQLESIQIQLEVALEEVPTIAMIATKRYCKR